MDYSSIIQTITVYAIPTLLAITLHEAAHGYVARYFGDNTAYAAGRLTLNPMAHVDPIGTLLMPLVIYLATAGSFFFGYAKPVPVDFSRLRNPKRDMVWVALAGPGSNLLQALGWGLLSLLLFHLQVQSSFLTGVVKAGLVVNAILCVFNLFPLPPLDGGRILVGLLPMRGALALARVEPYGFFVVLLLVVLGVINELWMRPLMGAFLGLVSLVLWPIDQLLQLVF